MVHKILTLLPVHSMHIGLSLSAVSGEWLHMLDVMHRQCFDIANNSQMKILTLVDRLLDGYVVKTENKDRRSIQRMDQCKCNPEEYQHELLRIVYFKQDY